MPPGVRSTVAVTLRNRHGSTIEWVLPRFQIYCGHKDCQGPRYYESDELSRSIYTNREDREFIVFICSNCKERRKLYALEIKLLNQTTAKIIKLGEDPPFGPPVSKRLLKLVGDSSDLLLKGYRCEKEQLGIAAFAYYRRVLDQQRVGIFDRLIEISRLLGAEDVARELDAARAQTQFKNAIEAVKHALPQALYIEGHNPLTLLHTALSHGLHDLSDGQCLEMAGNVRLVLTEMADRLDQPRKDDAELRKAVGRLTQKPRAEPAR